MFKHNFSWFALITRAHAFKRFLLTHLCKQSYKTIVCFCVSIAQQQSCHSHNMVAKTDIFVQDVLDLLHRISQYISGNMETVRDVWAAMGSSRDGCLEPTELAAFLRRLVKGISHREQHYLLMHIAGEAPF
jgi:hypothetical protein